MINFKDKIKQLFCKHRYGVKKWYPLDVEGQKLFKDIGLYVNCEKCNNFIILLPKIPNVETTPKEETQ